MPSAKIMIVEDMAIIAEDLRARTEDLGYSVIAAVPTGESALKQVDREPPDLILMDIRLAGEMDGIEAAEWIRAKSEIPIIFLTAHSDEEILARAKKTQPFGYLLGNFSISPGKSELPI